MTKEMLFKMVGGLSEDERKAALNDMGITDAALVAECLAYQPAASNAIQVTAPAIQPAAALPATAPAMQGNAVTDTAMQELQQRLATEQAARITAECNAFFTANASKVTPAEMTEAKKTYAALAALDDKTALNSYTASIQARPANPMLKEQVAAGDLQVLGNGSTDTRTETEKEAALVTQILGMTADGQAAQAALKTGSVTVLTPNGEQNRAINLQSALNQFAVTGETVTK